MVGETHKTGEEPDTERRYRNLEEWAREQFGVADFINRWSAQDYYSFDGLPYVGRIGVGSQHVYAATAFRAWGMTNETAAAMLLAALIAGKENRWADLYDSTRTASLATVSTAKEGVAQVARLAKDRLKGASGVADVAPGEGKIVGRAGARPLYTEILRARSTPSQLVARIWGASSRGIRRSKLGLSLPRVALLRGW